MKKLLTGFTMVFIAMVLFTPLANAQKAPFTGTVIYDVKAEGDLPEQAKAMMPKEMIIKIAADKQSSFFKSDMMAIKMISDALKQESYNMMSMMGQKVVIISTAKQLSDLKKKEGITTSFKTTNETKTIAGYLCKKVFMTVISKDGKEVYMDGYFTDDIDVSRFMYLNTFPEFKGFPLEFTMNVGPVSLRCVARNLKKEDIPASEFVIPSDYQPTTMEGLKSLFGGVAGQ